jgi:hypothetical protein
MRGTRALVAFIIALLLYKVSLFTHNSLVTVAFALPAFFILLGVSMHSPSDHVLQLKDHPDKKVILNVNLKILFFLGSANPFLGVDWARYFFAKYLKDRGCNVTVVAIFLMLKPKAVARAKYILRQ